MELIDKEALMSDMGEAQGCWVSCAGCEKINCLIGKIIDRQPAIEAEHVRNGEWKDRYNNGDWHCTVCGAIVEKDEQRRHNWYRCYHCGAKMDGGEKKQ